MNNNNNMSETKVKHGGRQKGTPNKVTRELRAVLKNFLSEEFERLPETLSNLQPREKADILVKLLPYALPRVSSESYKLGEGGIWDTWDD